MHMGVKRNSWDYWQYSPNLAVSFAISSGLHTPFAHKTMAGKETFIHSDISRNSLTNSNNLWPTATRPEDSSAGTAHNVWPQQE